MNIGLLISIPNGDMPLKLTQTLLNELSRKKDKNIVIFADSFFTASTSFPTMPVGNLNSFTGDLICTTAKDVIKAAELKRDINIKYICSTDVSNVEQTFLLDGIEYLSASDKDTYRAIALTGQNNIKTMKDWLDER